MNANNKRIHTINKGFRYLVASIIRNPNDYSTTLLVIQNKIIIHLVNRHLHLQVIKVIHIQLIRRIVSNYPT